MRSKQRIQAGRGVFKEMYIRRANASEASLENQSGLRRMRRAAGRFIDFEAIYPCTAKIPHTI